ncbi:hypothetical protein EhV337 [Emiliania huxleyi virus 86]|uniref:Uncharacterized protein n=1 Tax=Emiliania huxleyi virus 86 (isolate United Kingdom/English Channel/1999) TaxID=654925 RepID=Q4A2E2_EHV8U|nr:hypothetical protein EhV337 [Emiliania huxleyi virus 86]AEO97786.1 hypothetical protein ENVG_00253 [Emiliania huxleyi virus 84]AEP15264.1 hypothetical protein EOVG_00327 [Emiliania huxleyi virus 88]UKZ11361.1 hypothetical protein EhVM1_000346 [Emiliania huxleyi virus M1]CAI65764.1 hypothetical protein EhV337 [Emiliania huxleyi virus 86]
MSTRPRANSFSRYTGVSRQLPGDWAINFRAQEYDVDAHFPRIPTGNGYVPPLDIADAYGNVVLPQYEIDNELSTERNNLLLSPMYPMLYARAEEAAKNEWRLREYEQHRRRENARLNLKKLQRLYNHKDTMYYWNSLVHVPTEQYITRLHNEYMDDNSA